MSKLIDKLRKVGQNEAAPMGFGSFATRPKNPAMLLLAGLETSDAGSVQSALAAGADAVLLAYLPGPVNIPQASGGPSTATPSPVASGGTIDEAKSVVGAAGEAPVGVAVGGGSGETAKELHDAGVDFLVLMSLSVPAAMLHVEGPGKLLEVDPAWTDTMLRSVEGLPVDGIVLRVAGPLTLEKWMSCLRVVGLARKPVLISLGGSPDTATLRTLRDAGAGAVIVTPDAVAQARQVIDTLPSPKRPRDHREALLPSLPRRAPLEDDDEEE